MNEQTDSSVTPAPRRKGLAIASEVIGGLSFLTCSFFLVGAISGLVLGIIALRKAKKRPEVYGGKSEAKVGITFSILSLIVAVVILPNLRVSHQAGREAAALREMRVIGSAQIAYAYSIGHGRYTDLRTLGEVGLVDTIIATGEVGGYIFTVVPVEGGDKPMYDTTAKPTSAGFSGVGNRSFYSNETEIVYDVEGGTPPTATPQNRIPENGKPIE